MARQPGNPIDPPSLGPIVLGLPLPPPLPLGAPRDFLRGGGRKGASKALPGTAFVTIRQYWGWGWCGPRNLCFEDDPSPHFQSKRFGAGRGDFPAQF